MRGVPAKLVSLLQSMHKRVQVLFEVEGVKCSLESIIGVKQGDLKAPVEFVFFIAGIMLSWRAVSVPATPPKAESILQLPVAAIRPPAVRGRS